MIERICIILLVNIVYFAKTLCYKYTSDDVPVLQKFKNTKFGPVEKRFKQINGEIRVAEQQDHALTIFIHALVCVFIYLAFGATDISFIAAFLFAFNPINNQGSVWISGRSYAMATLMHLVAIAFPLLSPIALYCGMFYNIGYASAIILVIWNPWFAIPVVLGGILRYKRFRWDIGTKKKDEAFDVDKKIMFKKLILVVKTFGFYTVHSLIPIKTTFYHSFLQSMAGSGVKKSFKLDRFFWIGTLMVGVLTWKVFFMPWDLISFGLIWWGIGLAPFLNFYRISQEIAERYAYLPNVGLMIALASIISGHPMLIGAWIAMYATKLWFYMDAFQDDFYLAELSCFNSPDSWFAWHVKAHQRFNVKSYNEAIILWTMAKMISPNEFKVLFNLATMLKLCRKPKEADAFLALAMQNIPDGQEDSSQKLYNQWKDGKMSVLL